MRVLAGVAATAILTCGSSVATAQSDTATRIVTAQAHVGPRSALTVSSQVLQFHVASPIGPAVATVDFVAAIRAQAGAEVVLTVEVLGEALVTEGARLTFAGEGDTAISGALMAPRPAIAGRWIGSGRRSGRIAFALHTSVPGTHTLPVRLVLSAP